MNVLLVDRQEAARAWLKRALDPTWTYAEAATGVEALERARGEAFDLVITDQNAEPYGAFGLTRELKLLSEPPRVIILMHRRQDIWLARWAGADAWVMQPVDPFELVRVVTTPDAVTLETGVDVVSDAPPRMHAVAGSPFTEANEGA